MKDPTDPSSPETAAGPELPPRLLAKLRVEVPGYQLLEEIGSGGQATVYRAKELTSGLTVAIKILHGGPYADDATRERFRRETNALKALNHPNIVFAIESGRTSAGLDYLVMNYVAGKRLDALWKDRKFAAKIAPEPPARLRLFKKICDIVQCAHRAGITHRDLSPSNILLDDRGEPHILDFGLAATAFDGLSSSAAKNVTVTGQFIGKLKYASPEQARGERGAIDIRTDVYALGVILYQILTHGAFPYEVVGNVVDVLNNIIHSKPKPPSAFLVAANAETRSITPDKLSPLRQGPVLVNPTVEAIVLKALEKDPARRYESAGSLGEDIDRYLAGTPTSADVRNASANAQEKTIRRAKFRAKIIAIGCVILTIGVLMNTRVILNALGMSMLAAALGLGPATDQSNAPELTSLQRNQLLQLSDAEANIQAINRALAKTGYNVGQAYKSIESNQAEQFAMDKMGGGPVRWDAFYGSTAKDYHALGSWGDRRPQQFDYIYKANNDQISQANQAISSLKNDQSQLLARRQKHEEDQSLLWATLSWEQVKDREIGLEPISRYTLQPTGSKVAVLRPVVLFLRTANAVAIEGLDSIGQNQSGTFQAGGQRMAAAYGVLQQALADALDAQDLKPEDADEGKALKTLCKQLADECKVISDNYGNAQDRDKAKEDNSKLQFRGQLQLSLSDFANQVGALNDEVAKTVKDWGITYDRGTPTTDVVVAAPVPTGAASDVQNANNPQPTGAIGALSIPANPGWTNLLDPAQLAKWTNPTQTGGPFQPGADGIVIVNNTGYQWGAPVRDAVIRASVHKVDGQNLDLLLRRGDGVGYSAFFNGGNFFGIGITPGAGQAYHDLGTVRTKKQFPNFFVMQFSAIGDQLVLSADGTEILRVQNDQIHNGTVGIKANKGVARFRDIQVQILDKN